MVKVSAWEFSPEKIRDQAGDVNLTRYKRCGMLIQGVSGDMNVIIYFL